MGRYIDWQDLVARYQDVAKIGGAADTSTSWITAAEAYVDGRLATKYTVPFTPAPPMVQDLVMDLTYYRINMRQKWAGELRADLNARFEGLLNGTIALVDASGNVIDSASGSGAWSNTSSYASAFGLDDPAYWQVSSNWQQDLEDGRELG